MSPANVYYTSMRCHLGDSLLNKLDRLMTQAGLETIDFKRKFCAIKIHFGEPGNLAFLRPNFAKTVADRVKSLGGLPFLTDCGTLYVGRRTHALAHLEAAFENGYHPLAAGCHVLIGDGLKGTDDVEVPLPPGLSLKSARIGRAIMDADIVLSLNHFKGHELTGFGGAIKNLGMGSGSRGGKMIMHNDGRPSVDKKLCVGCGLCAKFCAHSAITIKKSKATIDHAKCVGCGRCLGTCNQRAVHNNWDSANSSLSQKMAEYALAVVQGRPNFHINVINQVSPYCDCHQENDAAVVPDLGIYASFDPVALDLASIEAVNQAVGLMGSVLAERELVKSDHLTNIHPNTNWRDQIAHSVKIGLGQDQYELIEVK
ncbi:MAG: DUF362 domain-containing protein [Deltaproteobacteria bacterium]|jgi:uncharacterized Fe-S center protein|nr:DUF362 domain-containing protein [Deltaproteobacteria bacterium]